MLRVFRPTPFYGQFIFTEHGHLCKRPGKAVALADKVDGYVVDLATGRRVYESPNCPH